ncbi:nuclear transport factor 2 family protein [Streptomyces gobiensis]|uniref:nuclear transport factor 2 family protein n=1 Tax=Streptomyces gobiensis TaxID=2875706 RepID=UPI001E436CB6|nr:nuclear transport factor 2 family protein [Streptomyces gobiensis]UGY93393.1 nuclear transport factor 2 family protein [Streptomyces gobiensis]
MSEHPDITLVRQWWDACMKDLDAAGAMMTADVMHHVPGTHPLAGHYKGRDTVLQMYRQFGDLIKNMEFGPVTMLTDGRGHVLAVSHNRYERQDRGIELHEGLLFTITGGKISDIDEFTENIEASDTFWS